MTDKTIRKHFILRTDREKQAAAEYLLNLPAKPLQEVVVRDYEKTRTLPQNSRYWATLTELLEQTAAVVQEVSNETGYTPLEVKRLIAKDMAAEHVAILFARKTEVAHDVIKEICNVPTSTRLGTKKFMQFEDRMVQAVAEIQGEVNAFARRAA